MRRHSWEWVRVGWALLIAMLPSELIALEDQSRQDSALLAPISALSPADGANQYAHHSPAYQSVFTLAAGVRRDDLTWNIAGNSTGGAPNILSELEWSHVDSYQLRLDNRTVLADRVYLRGQVGYAWVDDGKVRDSDYAGDNRTDEFSRSISDSDGDQLWDLLAGVGVPIYMGDRRFMVVPLLGISMHKQNLRIRNGRQVLTEPGGPRLGPLEGLNSTYQAEWFAPFLGCDLRFSLTPQAARFARMEAGLEVQWHWDARFEAEADWNLRSDFDHPKSFSQRADGSGVSLTAEWVVWFTPQWALNASASYQKWETDPGRQRYFLADGRTATTRLNEVDWESNSYMLGLSYQFD